MPITISGNGIITGIQNVVNDQNNLLFVQDSAGRLICPKLIGFFAYGIGRGTFANNNYMVFPSTRWNNGNHYNTITGRFTAPVSGSYVFWWSTIANLSNDVYRHFIRVNQSNVAGGRHLRSDTIATGTSQYGTNFAQEIVINLNKDDFVQIFFSSDSGTSLYPGANSDADNYLYFTGYLLG
jgi:hypothetical protein